MSETMDEPNIASRVFAQNQRFFPGSRNPWPTHHKQASQPGGASDQPLRASPGTRPHRAVAGELPGLVVAILKDGEAFRGHLITPRDCATLR